MDVSQEQQVVDLFNTIDARLGSLTGLVNNAGILLPQMLVEQMDAERINRLLTTNVTSYFLCCREAIKRMALTHEGQGGAIVNVSSAAARLGAAFEYVDYAASKGAIDTLTRGLSIEVARAIAWLLSEDASYVTGSYRYNFGAVMGVSKANFTPV